MSRISKKYHFFSLAIITVIAILVCILYLFLFFLHSNLTQISYTTLHFDKNKEKLFLNGNLLWDTGADASVIYEEHKDKILNRIRIGNVSVIDYFYKKRFVPFYYSSQFTISDSVNIRNFFFSTIKDVPERTKQNYEIGLIGMDVISKANWTIDFDSEKVDITPHNKIYKTEKQPHLILKYKRRKTPKTQLNFAVCKLENILIDAGFNCDITLLKSDIEAINRKYKPIDTLTFSPSGLHSVSDGIMNSYIYSTIQINNICFSNVEIAEGCRRLIGFKFFKRFNKVFLNTKEKEFCFY